MDAGTPSQDPQAAIAEAGNDIPREPIWLVRAVLALVLLGFSAFVARQASAFVRTIGGSATVQEWTLIAVLMAAALLVGYLLGRTRRRGDRRLQP